MRLLLKLLRDLCLLGLLGVAAWFFPRTVLAAEIVFGIASYVFYRVEQSWQ